jgi:hypothetical protein
MKIAKIDIRSYVYYKFLSSTYAGSALGSIFIIYASLQPVVFSIGGIALAIGGWIVALFYVRMIKLGSFFVVGGIVETLLLVLTVCFVVFHNSTWIAFFVYSLYQIGFLFGGYLVRAETKLLSRTKLFSIFDKAKQMGYLAGLSFSFIAYETFGRIGIEDAKEQIVYLYTSLILLQIVVLIFYSKAFSRYLTRHERRD